MIDQVDNLVPQLNCQETSFHSFNGVNIHVSDLNVLYFNARSIVGKLSELVDILSLLKSIYLIIIAEIWLTYDIAPYFNLPGYESAHVCREGKMGGGVSIFAREALHMAPCKLYTNNCEFIHVTIKKRVPYLT